MYVYMHVCMFVYAIAVHTYIYVHTYMLIQFDWIEGQGVCVYMYTVHKYMCK